MSKQIWKYIIPYGFSSDAYKLAMPLYGKIIHVHHQENQIYLWAEIDPQQNLEYRYFIVVGTGWELPDVRKYRGTVHINKFVWHVYEVDGNAAPAP